MKTWKGFRDEFAFLSNFSRFETPLVYNSIIYNTNEHFYQAMKFKDDNVRFLIANHPSKGLKAFCKDFPLREDWDDIKENVMRYGLEYKFSKRNPTLRSKIIKTQGIELVEYNWWGDKYWGVCSTTDVGENRLGKMLMEIREKVIEENN